MRKRWLSLLLALVMLASVTVTTASADTVNLLDKTVTLSVIPSQSAICVGSTGDVYVTYTISIASDDGKTPIPAFSFVVPTDGKLATQAQTNNSDWYYWFNTDELMQWDEAKETGGHGPYKVAGYTKSSGYVGVGGSDNNGITEKTTVMTIVAKFPAGAEAEIYAPAFAKEDFIAGGGETIDGTGGVKVSNAFGTRNVQVDPVTVKPGTTVSGTVKDSSGKAGSGATVELYKDGTKVADATAGTDGKYTISNVSTGTYTVKAKTTVDGKELNGSDDVTVTDGDTTKDITVAKGVTVSGTIKSYGSASEAVTVTLLQGTSVIGSPQVLTGASGSVPYSQNYSFPAVPAGEYTLKVEKKGHVTREYAVTVVSAPVVQAIKIYMLGDINEDGSINIQDVIRLLNHVNNSNTISDTKHCDINKDGAVNIQDVIRLLNHVNNNQPLF